MDKNITLLANSKIKTSGNFNIVNEAYNFSCDNIAKPFINTAVIEPVDSIIDLANLIPKAIHEPGQLKDIPKFKLEQAKFLSLNWFAQSLSAGIGYSIPFGISTKISEIGLGKLTLNLNEGSQLTYLANMPMTSQVVGALSYGAIMTPASPQQSRLGDSIGSAVGFGVFGLSNGITGNIFTKTALRSITGALGGIVSDASSTLISQHQLPSTSELMQAGVSGAALNSVFSTLADSNLKISDNDYVKISNDNLNSNYLHINDLFKKLKEDTNNDLDKAKTEFQIASSLIKTINDSGFKARIVGGSVRDLLLNKLPKDFDIATSAKPEELEKILAKAGIKTLPVGKSFGVTIVNVDGHQVELATLRQDGNYLDGRRPDSVSLIRDFKVDAARRDFTINSIFLDPNSGHLYDYFDGVGDLKAKIIKAVGDPNGRINEDKLRMLRAIRFATKLDGFKLDDSLTKAIQNHASEINAVSSERIQAELRQILLSPNAVKGLDLMTNLGLMQHIIPELEALAGSKGRQDPTYHPEGNAWNHTKMVVGELTNNPNRNLVLMMAGLLHDIAKPQTQEINENGRITNYGHAEIGAKVASEIAKRLKFSNEEINQISELVNLHMQMHEVTKMRQSTLTRILLRPDIDNLIALEHADTLGRAGGPYKSNYDFLRSKLTQLKLKNTSLDFAQTGKIEIKPIVTGQTLIKLGLKPGPAFKAILDDSYSAQLDGLFDDSQNATGWLSNYLKAK